VLSLPLHTTGFWARGIYGASPDGLIQDSAQPKHRTTGVWECKSRWGNGRDVWRYVPQIYVQMYCTRTHWAYLTHYKPGVFFEIYKLTWDDKVWKYIDVNINLWLDKHVLGTEVVKPRRPHGEKDKWESVSMPIFQQTMVLLLSHDLDPEVLDEVTIKTLHPYSFAQHIVSQPEQTRQHDDLQCWFGSRIDSC
jgi:hypothetical protein